MDRMQRKTFFSGVGVSTWVSLTATSYISLIDLISFFAKNWTFLLFFLLNDFIADCCHSIVSLPQAEIKLFTCVSTMSGNATIIGWLRCWVPCWGQWINRLWWFDDITFRSETAGVLVCQEKFLLSCFAWIYQKTYITLFFWSLFGIFKQFLE